MLQISIKQTFLNEFLKIPRNIAEKANQKIKELKNNPRQNGNHSGQLKSNPDVYYTSVTRDYRLFYCFDTHWIQILSIGDRRDCYKKIYQPDLLVLFPEDIDFNALSIDENKYQDFEVNYSITSSESLLQEADLRNWLIPEKFWEQLLQVKNEDDFLKWLF